MKIGIITSGNEMLSLFKFLNKYDNEYIIYYDFSNGPYGDKTFDESFANVKKGIDFLIKKGVEKIILPPVYELKLLASSGKLKAESIKHQASGFKPAKEAGGLQALSSYILPLFKNYLLNYVFKYSLVGKIGMVGDYTDIQVAQELISDLSKEFNLTENQKSIKKFNFPFSYWCKEVGLWKSYLNYLSYSDFMVNKVIKFDLRYFKDAMVDVVVPLNYGYFNYEKTISKFFNFKKIKFHGIEKLEEIFQGLGERGKGKGYGVKVYFTGHNNFLIREKRLMWMLQKGKGVEVEWERI